MRIEVKASGGKVVIAACNDECGLVALGEGARLDEAAKNLVSKFAKQQAETIEALGAAGIIRHVTPESLS